MKLFSKLIRKYATVDTVCDFSTTIAHLELVAEGQAALAERLEQEQLRIIDKRIAAYKEARKAQGIINGINKLIGE